ncbi:MAG: hypothetical protein EOP10_12410 [Proteobacteria bacterium]|nr:MAG: hypothetical protein EOP10_12410 [Pseudomonadota bacterium]
MRNTVRLRTLAPVVIFLLVLFKPAQVNAGDEDDRAQNAAMFRNIFYSLAKGQFQDDDIHKLIYVPEERFYASAKVEGVDPFEERVTDYNSIAPFDLYSKGLDTPFEEIKDVDSAVTQNPVTIVVIPGIFGEFIQHFPFHEVLVNKDSQYSKTWKAAIAKKPTVDRVFDLEQMRDLDTDLDKLVEVASIDNPAGKDLVRVIYLKPLFGSMETLGTIKDSSDIYLRRLAKIRKVLGGFQNLYLMGYSRGLNVALELAHEGSQDAEANPWFQDLKGVLSLGGTLYGSALADGAFEPGKPSCAALERMNRLADELITLPEGASLGDKVKTVAMNAAAWATATTDMISIGTQMQTAEGLEVENIPTDSLNWGAFGGLLRAVVFEKFKIIEGSEYNNNVEKFKLLIREVTEGAQSITKNTTISWQRTHTLPTNISYFVLQGTMGDPSTKATGPSFLSKSSVSFNTKAIDYSSLRRSYYDYYADTQSKMNDSQVSPDRTLFWPAYHKILNPAQADYRTQILAVIGVDHWGMSFPVALESRNKEMSPYPRTILLHSVGAFLARDLLERSAHGR